MARTLIVGCGGIGGVLGSTLHRAGVPVAIATPNEQVRKVWTTSGPYLGKKKAGGPLPRASIRGSATDFGTSFDTVFIAVQPPQVETVTKEVAKVLSPSGRIVCLSNGLCEEHMSKFIDAQHIVGAVVSWGARMKQPGRYTRTSGGGFRLGKLDAAEDPRLDDIEQLLNHVGPVKRTTNLKGARFSKLTINCAVTALGTVGGKTLGQLLLRTEARYLALALMREAAEVAVASGIRMEPVTKVDLAKLATSGQSSKKFAKVAQHALLLAAGARYRRLRSSMLAAMERGREPAIDYINGEVVKLGKRFGVRTPYNSAATRVVWEIFQGQAVAGPEALSRLRALAEVEV